MLDKKDTLGSGKLEAAATETCEPLTLENDRREEFRYPDVESSRTSVKKHFAGGAEV